MKPHKPLTDEEGEVRELLMENIRRFRPMADGISRSLATKLGINASGTGNRQTTAGKPDHTSRMEDAGVKAPRAKKKNAAPPSKARRMRHAPR
jgi:hypothetical protein